MEKKLKSASSTPKPQLHQEYADLFKHVLIEKQREIAERFDSFHCVQRALTVGSLDAIVEPAALGPGLLDAIEAGLVGENETQPARARTLQVAKA